MSASSDDDEYGDDYEDDYSESSVQGQDDTPENITDHAPKRSQSPLQSNDENVATIDQNKINNVIVSNASSTLQREDGGINVNIGNHFTASNLIDQNQTSLKKSQRQLWVTSKLVVLEGEKNITLALDLAKVRDELKIIQEENKQLRHTLLNGINTNVSYDVEKFMNIPLHELLRLCLKEYNDNASESYMNFSLSGSRKFDNHQSEQIDKVDEQKPESEIKNNLDTEEENQQLKQKLSKMMNSSRREREIKMKLERDNRQTNQRIGALSEHIEKLMVHLKHEAISKAKTLSECSRCHKEIDLLKKRNQTMEKSNLRKDRGIDDLKEGAKILEDQLTLMDEKYMELRMKLDWTRTQTERVMRKKEEEIKDLRGKLLLVKQDLVVCRSKKKNKSKTDVGGNSKINHNANPTRKANTHKLPTSDGIT